MPRKVYQPTPTDRIMAEVVVLGGLPVTRHDAARLFKASGWDARQRDWLQACALEAVPGTVPMPYEIVAPVLLQGAAR